MREAIKATLPKEDVSNAINYGGKKELTEAMSVVVYSKGKLIEAVCARFYMGRSASAMTGYCSVLVHGNDRWTSGAGIAAGGGYHKFSAALDEAIRSAGITLSRSVSGTGECQAALEAIAAALYPRAKQIFVSHG